MQSATRARARTGGSDARPVDMAEGNGVERMRRIEESVAALDRRISDLDDRGTRKLSERVSVMESEFKHLAIAVEDLGKEVKGLRNTVIGAVVAVMLSAFGIAATVLLTGGGQ